MSQTKGRVVRSGKGGDWMLDVGPHLKSMSCHHKKSGACGGCYARAIDFIGMMSDSGSSFAKEILDTIVQEGQELKAGKKRK